MGSDYAGFLCEVMKNPKNIDCDVGYTALIVLKTIELHSLSGRYFGLWIMSQLQMLFNKWTSLTMSSEMDSRQLAVYNDKNQFVWALAIDTWVNLVSSNLSCFQWDIY